MKKKKFKIKRDLKLRFIRMQTVIAAFLVLVVVLCLVQWNVPYKRQSLSIEPINSHGSMLESEDENPESLIIWENEVTGKMGLEMMESVLSQMKISYDTCEAEEIYDIDFGLYETVIFSVTHYEQMGEEILNVMDWVDAGGKLMIIYPPEVQGIFQSISRDIGIEQIGNDYHLVSGIHFPREFMLGGNLKDYKITDPYESALTVILSDDCMVYAESDDTYSVPLIWKRKVGEGTIVFDNLGFLEKAFRGFYSSSYSLLEDVCVYPVINSSAFYIDDFPSPVPAGNSQYIERDYGMSISDFYTQIWWRDVYNLAEKYGIQYTGLVIEQYSDQVEGSFKRNDDIQRYRYFGNMLLDQGGEIGLHGYNHMPLCLIGFDYKGEYDSYRLWNSLDDIKNSLTELTDFCELLFPQETFQVYVPPSNILSEQGREVLIETTDVKAIASVYLPDWEGIAYAQEFEVKDDGIIETPRIISGYILDDYTYLSALSELNFHYVNSHFQHPDDTLDEDRGADLGWEEMYGRLSDYVEWLYTAAPDIRNLTGTEFAAAVQIYDQLQVKRECTDNKVELELGGFQNEAWFMVRMNEGLPGKVSGGSLEQLMGDLYLLKASESLVEIEIR